MMSTTECLDNEARMLGQVKFPGTICPHPSLYRVFRAQSRSTHQMRICAHERVIVVPFVIWCIKFVRVETYRNARDNHTELFVQFARQCFEQSLAFLALASRKKPVPFFEHQKRPVTISDKKPCYITHDTSFFCCLWTECRTCVCYSRQP